MKFEAARRFALSLPETTEEPHFDLWSFRVKGKIFATVPPKSDQLRIFVDADETHAAVSADPEAFEELWWGKRLSGVQVNLAAADAAVVYALLEESWRRKAPKRLAASYTAKRPHR